MNYSSVCPGIFLSRPNRFIAYVQVEGQTQICHVKNTGRCRELLIPGVTVYLQKSSNPLRKTPYDLIAVQKGERLVNIDSQAPNGAFLEYLKSGAYIEGLTLTRPEIRWGGSRFDFYAQAGPRKIFIEVKGVTLEEDGAVLFPDAPTERGVRHLRELIACVNEGYEAHAVFVIQMKDVAYFSPNDKTHPAFGAALREAFAAGVKITALDCEVTPDSIRIGRETEVRL